MRKRMKQILSLLIVMTLAVSVFTGCGDKKEKDKGSGSSSTVNGVNPEDYRGSSITLVTWKDPALNEDGPVVKKFEEEYGIEVKVQLVEESEYINTIAGDIAAGTQGDVCFITSRMPSAYTIMQPLDEAKLDLTDPIWDQITIKDSEIAGHPYLVNTISNIWSEVDVCVYNKRIFEENGIKTPAEYYEEGTWTLEAFERCCRQVAALGKDYLGAAVRGPMFLGGIGASFFSYDNEEFRVSVDERLYAGMQFLSELNADKLINPGMGNFADEKTGMAITDSFGLKRTGHFSTMNPDHIGVTYLPRFDQDSEQVLSGTYRGWGLIKGAKNPVAAGIFLRYYLDVNNYDLDLTFHSQELADFFFEATEATYQQRKKTYYTDGLREVSGYYSNEYWATDFEKQYERSPAQLRAWIESQLPLMETMVEEGNKVVQQARKEVIETYGESK